VNTTRIDEVADLDFIQNLKLDVEGDDDQEPDGLPTEIGLT